MKINYQYDRVYIDPSFDYRFGSWYLQGLYEVFGKRNVDFSSFFFNEFKTNNHFMAVVVFIKEKRVNLVIDFADSGEVDSHSYNWSDKYAKVNVKSEDLEKYSKLITIGPNFAIKVNSVYSTFKLCFLNLLKSWSRIPEKKLFIRNYYLSCINALPLSAYHKYEETDNFIFFVSSIWEKNTNTNEYRSNFFDACNLFESLNLELGFTPRNDGVTRYEGKTRKKQLTIKNYVRGFRKSFFVFNAPSVFDCHGWKLGEFCAMSKLIISVPLTREMPGIFKADMHFLQCDGSVNEIKKQIVRLIEDEKLRNTLKTNVESYYKEYLTPSSVIQRIISFT
jgi:hypothetical protein